MFLPQTSQDVESVPTVVALRCHTVTTEYSHLFYKLIHYYLPNINLTTCSAQTQTRIGLLDYWPSHHDRRRELAAVYRVPRRRFLAHDREHKASADSHVDELAAFRRQQHHALEPAISL
jgi:hypothetical protein